MLQRIEAVEWSYEMEQRGLERRRRIPNRAELAASSAPPESRPLGPSSPPVLKPHARFSIERAKSMVSIKFDPPAYVSRNPVESHHSKFADHPQ